MVDRSAYCATLNENQLVAFNAIADAKKGSIIRIVGYAGTGKTYMIGKVLDYLAMRSEEQFIFSRDKIFVGAPTHQAKQVLQSKISSKNIIVSTIHSGMNMKLHVDDRGKQKFVPAVRNLFGDKNANSDVEGSDIVICEECSMISKDVGKILMGMWEVNRFTLVVIGDDAQIPPVDDDTSYLFSREFESTYKPTTIELNQIIRQAEGSPIIKLATDIRNNLSASVGDMMKIIASHIEPDGGLITAIGPESMSSKVVPLFTGAQFDENIYFARCLAYNVARAEKYSNFIRKKRIGDYDNWVEGDIIIYNAMHFAKVDVNGVEVPIQVNNNCQAEILELEDQEVQLFDTTFTMHRAKIIDIVDKRIIHGVTIPYMKDKADIDIVCDRRRQIISRTANSSERKQEWKHYYSVVESISNVSPLYGLTCHKSQGNTFTYAIVDVLNIMGNFKVEERNRILYTAVTRASHALLLKVRQ